MRLSIFEAISENDFYTSGAWRHTGPRRRTIGRVRGPAPGKLLAAGGYPPRDLPEQTVKISVVIPTYNRRSMLPSLIQPLLDDPALGELIMVVDGSVDGSYEYLSGVAETDPRLRPTLTANRGEARARRLAVELAQSDFVLVLDDDVVAEPGLVSRHAKRHRESDSTLVVGYMPVKDTSSVAAATYARSYQEKCSLWESDNERILLDLWAGNLSLRRADYLRATEREFRHPYEFHADRAFGYRCFQIGLQGVFARECVAYHHYSRNADGLARDARNSGRAQIHLWDEFPQLHQPDTFELLSEGMSRRLEQVMKLARRPRFGRLLAWTLRSAARVAERYDAKPAGYLIYLMVRVERQLGLVQGLTELTSPGGE